MASVSDSGLSRLRRQWAFLGMVGAGYLVGGTGALTLLLGGQRAVRWGLQAAVVLAWVFVRLGRALELNYGPAGPGLRPSLGTANLITLARAALTASLAGFLFQALPVGAHPTWSWLPGVLYLTAAVMDYADGSIARATGTITRLGEVLDTEIDALGLLVASLLLVSSHKTPLPYLWVGFGYYVLQTAIRVRKTAGRPVASVAPRAGARWIAGCEMGFAAAALLPVFSPEATYPGAWVMAMGLWVSLGQDWLVVCGRATPEGCPRDRGLRSLERTLAGVLPVLLRTVVAAGIARTLCGWPADNALPLSSGAVKTVFIAAGTLCVLGVAARCAAMILSLMTAAWLIPALPGITSAMTVAAALCLMLTGAGHPRLCQPEDRFVMAQRAKRRV